MLSSLQLIPDVIMPLPKWLPVKNMPPIVELGRAIGRVLAIEVKVSMFESKSGLRMFSLRWRFLFILMWLLISVIEVENNIVSLPTGILSLVAYSVDFSGFQPKCYYRKGCRNCEICPYVL